MREIRTAAVIGAGNMGSGIAQKYAAEGFRVVLLDVDAASVQRGILRIEETLREAVARKIYREDAARSIEERILATTDWGALADVDLVVEAVFEDLEVKGGVFRRLGEVTRPDAILGTNTSSFYVRQLAELTRHPERVIGLHYFYHPAKNRLVEVIRAPQTSDEVVARAWGVQERIGKTPIASADRPGFVVNRFFVPWINEAARILEDGLADIPTIEAAAKQQFGIGLGPFELMNLTGIPIGYHAAATLARELGAFYAPSDVIRRQMEVGRPFSTAGEPVGAKFPAVVERLLGVTFHVACQLVSEGVGTIEDTDIGARVGLRWAKGPFEMMNRLGVAEASALSGKIETMYGLATPALLRTHAESRTRFPIRLVKSETRDGIATLTVNRPDAMNALNPEVAAQLEQALQAAEADPAVRGIAIAGAGKAFIAGADIGFFVRNIDRGKFDEIDAFARHGHAILRRIETGSKPVVAKMDGLALGGGLELALACDAIVATERASMAFPETGIGIYPGLGGTQRPSRRSGTALARWLVDTGQMLDARTALAIGLIDRVASHDDLDGAVRAAIDGVIAAGVAKSRAARSGPALSAPPAAVASNPALAATARLFAESSIEDLLGPSPAGEDPALAKLRSRVQSKSRSAVRRADALIQEGARLPLEAALALELQHMAETFRSPDAREGLGSVLERRPPKFTSP